MSLFLLDWLRGVGKSRASRSIGNRWRLIVSVNAAFDSNGIVQQSLMLHEFEFGSKWGST